jgi:hypothetical protein
MSDLTKRHPLPAFFGLYAAAWCAVAIGLPVMDWRFWRGRSAAPEPAVAIEPLVSHA